MKSSERHLNVICFDIPYPPDYGGVIDVFYKLRAFHQKGIHTHLHCFQYSRNPSPQLENICESVHYYQRNVSKSQLFSRLPYIVISRMNEQLLENISSNSTPVLFEGLHSTFYLNDEKLKGRKKIVRTHNIEHDYYRSLAQVENNIFRRYYFNNEASKLESYEQMLKHADTVAAISPNDDAHFQSRYQNSFYLPAFHSNDKVNIQQGRGSFAFYHGNLSVGENNSAALFLIREVFSKLSVQLVIAGKNPSQELKSAADSKNNVTLVPNPSSKDIMQLLSQAHVNVLPAIQQTGIKLKLLNALHNGRFCIANRMMVSGTGLESLCVVADSESEFIAGIRDIFQKEFSSGDIKIREDILSHSFSNSGNMDKLLMKIF